MEIFCAQIPFPRVRGEVCRNCSCETDFALNSLVLTAIRTDEGAQMSALGCSRSIYHQNNEGRFGMTVVVASPLVTVLVIAPSLLNTPVVVRPVLGS